MTESAIASADAAAGSNVDADDDCHSEGNRQVDWEYAHEELMAKQGIDLKAEMAKKLKELEEQFLREKEEASKAFQEERKKYEDQISSVQKQVMEQSVTMSMISSFTPDDFQNNEEDVFGIHN